MARYMLYPIDKGFTNQYDDDFDPRVTNAFATAAFRFGHSQIPGEIRYLKNNQALKRIINEINIFE